MIKEEATEKIIAECKKHKHCGDCTFNKRGNFTQCAIAIVVNCHPKEKDDERQG